MGAKENSVSLVFKQRASITQEKIKCKKSNQMKIQMEKQQQQQQKSICIWWSIIVFEVQCLSLKVDLPYENTI